MGKKITDLDFLKAELQMGISFENEQFVQLASATASQFISFDIDTVLDYGAGTGVYTDGFIKQGFDVYTFEIWDAHKEYMKAHIPKIKLVDEPVQTDLLCWIEVAEHMTNEEIEQLFNQISPKYILFSSTSERTDWDQEWGHINVKEQFQWIEYFERFGYELLKSMEYPTPWTKLFINGKDRNK
jgi:2-polyprenyl-3-methyl-5-hydroxy-6-metoxy-1,4-benzoquinol methylase